MRVTVDIPNRHWEAGLEYVKWLASKEDVELGTQKASRYLKECIQQLVNVNLSDDPCWWVGDYYIPS